jgi:hypothetical protein
MKKIAVVIFLLLNGIEPLFAQVKIDTLTSKELKELFDTFEPLEVLDIIRKSSKRLDYEEYYKNENLRPKLLKWLDRELYLQQDLDKTRNVYKQDSIYLANKIFARVKQVGISVDSLSTFIYNSYKDSIINELMEIQESRIRREGLPFPKPIAIQYHTKLGYPESYSKIRSFWIEDEMGEKSPFYLPLVYLGDPKARKLFDNYILNVAEGKVENIALNKLMGLLVGELRGSYGVQKSVELLEVDRGIRVFSGDEETRPFNCQVVKFLVSDIFNNKIPIDKIVGRRDSCEEHLKHLSEIKAASQRLVEYYSDQESYWMSNMPFHEE